MSSKPTDAHNYLQRPLTVDGSSRVVSNRPNSFDPIKTQSSKGSEEEIASTPEEFDASKVDHIQIEGGPESQPPVVKIFLDKIPKRASLSEIHNKLSEFGAVRYLRVPFSPQKNKNMGYGQVVFEDQELAKRLIQQKPNFMIHERVVALSLFVSRNTKRKEFVMADPIKFDLIAHSRRAKNQTSDELPLNIKRDISLLLEQEAHEDQTPSKRETAALSLSHQEPTNRF